LIADELERIKKQKEANTDNNEAIKKAVEAALAIADAKHKKEVDHLRQDMQKKTTEREK
jgi:hypothetical protein